MEQNVSMKINELPSPTWNWLKVNETPIKWSNKIEPCEIAAEGDVVATETEQLSDIETGAGREADAIFATENTAKYQILADNAGQDKTVRLHISGKKDAHTAGCVEIVAKENSTLTVVMDSRVAPDATKEEDSTAEASLAVRVRMKVESGASVRLVQVQMPQEHETLLSDIGGNLIGEGAKVEYIQLFLGKGNLYSGCRMDLNGKESNFATETGYLGQAQQILDYNMVANHFGEKTMSYINSDGALRGQAHKVFRGTIDFKRGSSGAEGQEEESVLLLGDDVENKTIPLILCAQEDVKGNHGATIGELDEDTMFYFGARGIDREAAERIVTGAKLEHICDLMKDEAAEKIAKEALKEVI